MSGSDLFKQSKDFNFTSSTTEESGEQPKVDFSSNFGNMNFNFGGGFETKLTEQPKTDIKTSFGNGETPNFGANPVNPFTAENTPSKPATTSIFNSQNGKKKGSISTSGSFGITQPQQNQNMQFGSLFPKTNTNMNSNTQEKTETNQTPFSGGMGSSNTFGQFPAMNTKTDDKSNPFQQSKLNPTMNPFQQSQNQTQNQSTPMNTMFNFKPENKTENTQTEQQFKLPSLPNTNTNSIPFAQTGNQSTTTSFAGFGMDKQTEKTEKDEKEEKNEIKKEEKPIEKKEESTRKSAVSLVQNKSNTKHTSIMSTSSKQQSQSQEIKSLQLTSSVQNPMAKKDQKEKQSIPKQQTIPLKQQKQSINQNIQNEIPSGSLDESLLQFQTEIEQTITVLENDCQTIEKTIQTNQKTYSEIKQTVDTNRNYINEIMSSLDQMIADQIAFTKQLEKIDTELKHLKENPTRSEEKNISDELKKRVEEIEKQSTEIEKKIQQNNQDKSIKVIQDLLVENEMILEMLKEGNDSH